MPGINNPFWMNAETTVNVMNQYQHFLLLEVEQY